MRFGAHPARPGIRPGLFKNLWKCLQYYYHRLHHPQAHMGQEAIYHLGIRYEDSNGATFCGKKNAKQPAFPEKAPWAENRQVATQSGRATSESLIKDGNPEGEGRDYEVPQSFGQGPEKSDSGHCQEEASPEPESTQEQPMQSWSATGIFTGQETLITREGGPWTWVGYLEETRTQRPLHE